MIVRWRRIAGLFGLCVLLSVAACRTGPASEERIVVTPEAWKDHPERDRITRLLEDAQERRAYENTWLGVRLMQFADDLVLYQAIVAETKPDWIIETGTAHGGSALYFSTLLEAIHPEGKILTVDIDGAYWRDSLAKHAPPPRLLDRITFLEGSSTDPALLEQIRARVAGARTLVVLDSLHAAGHVYEELRSYSEFVRPGDYLLVNDTHIEGETAAGIHPGPFDGVRKFLAENPGWQIAPDRQPSYVSCLHSGILQRR